MKRYYVIYDFDGSWKFTEGEESEARQRIAKNENTMLVKVYKTKQEQEAEIASNLPL